MHDARILLCVKTRAAIFLWYGQAKQAHLFHLSDDIIGNFARFYDVLFRRDQPFAHIAVQLLVKLLECFGVHATIGAGLAHGLV